MCILQSQSSDLTLCLSSNFFNKARPFQKSDLFPFLGLWVNKASTLVGPLDRSILGPQHSDCQNNSIQGVQQCQGFLYPKMQSEPDSETSRFIKYQTVDKLQIEKIRSVSHIKLSKPSRFECIFYTPVSSSQKRKINIKNLILSPVLYVYQT